MDINNFSSIITSTEGAIKELQGINYNEVKRFSDEISTKFKEFKEGGQALINEGKILKIGVVGQVKAGKSSFLNSLMFNGEDVLPKASTPMTAGLTILEYGESNFFEVEYYDEKEWNEFVELDRQYLKVEAEVRANKDFEGAPDNFILKEVQKRTNYTQQSAHELVVRCGGCARSKVGKGTESVPFTGVAGLQSRLNEYVGAEGQYTSVVKSLYIHLNDERLKDIRIVDTPGVNDPITSREARTHQFLHSCHGVFFLSSASRFFDSKDMSFMNTRIGNKGVGTVVLLASKYDSVLQDLGLQLRGGQHEGDLEYADNMAQSNLRNRFELSRNNLENPNVNILFDTTSGISFSIASKNPNDWDPVEANVVKQMKTFYPDAFMTQDEANDTFLMLANMDEIKKSYLDGTFINDKDSIIQHKMSEYFSEAQKDIKGVIEIASERMHVRLKELDSVELEDLHNQLKRQDELFEKLKSQFGTFISKFQNGFRSEVMYLNETISRPELYSVPTTDTLVDVSFKGKLWGTNTDSFPARVLDTNELKNQIVSQVKTYIETWQQEWRKYFDKGKMTLFDEFCKSITEFSNETTDLKFSDSYYRNLMEDVLSDIERYKILELKNNQDETLKRIVNYCDSQEISLTSMVVECKEDGVQARLNSRANDICNKAKLRIQQELKGLVDTVKPVADSNAKHTIQKMDELKKTIADKLKGAGQEYIKKLEEDIKHKKEIKQMIENASILLDRISSNIN